MPNNIQISACDNQLLIVAFQGADSFVLANITSGYNYPVDVTLDIVPGSFTQTLELDGLGGPLMGSHQVSLPSHSYDVALVGINWGGPSDFQASLNGIPFTHIAPPSTDQGVVWTPEVQQMNV